MWREAESGGLFVDGEFIPGGYDVGTCIYAIHHNEAYFPDSFAFIPERWLSSSSKPDQNLGMRDAYSPFSFGPRGCIGRPLAIMEISVTIARVMWLMDFRKAKGEIGAVGEGISGASDGRQRVEEFQLYSHLTSWAKGPFLEFRHA